jgi:hypothetical protein
VEDDDPDEDEAAAAVAVEAVAAGAVVVAVVAAVVAAVVVVGVVAGVVTIFAGTRAVNPNCEATLGVAAGFWLAPLVCPDPVLIVNLILFGSIPSCCSVCEKACEISFASV